MGPRPGQGLCGQEEEWRNEVPVDGMTRPGAGARSGSVVHLKSPDGQLCTLAAGFK